MSADQYEAPVAKDYSKLSLDEKLVSKACAILLAAKLCNEPGQL